jgi:hypothetical protein
VRCSSFSEDSASAADAAPEAAGPDGGLTDATDPDACVPFLTDDFQRQAAFGPPWADSLVFGDGGARIYDFDGGVRGLVVDVPPPSGGFLLVNAVPDGATSAELEYDTAVGFEGDAGGPDGGALWGVGFPEFGVEEPEASVRFGMSVFYGVWLVDGVRNFHDAAVTDTSAYAPVNPLVGEVHVRLVVTFGSAGGVAVTTTNSTGGTQTQYVPFPSGAGLKRLGVGVTTAGASPRALASFAHVRACWR